MCEEPTQTVGLQRASFRPRLRGGGVSRQENLGCLLLATNYLEPRKKYIEASSGRTFRLLLAKVMA